MTAPPRKFLFFFFWFFSSFSFSVLPTQAAAGGGIYTHGSSGFTWSPYADGFQQAFIANWGVGGFSEVNYLDPIASILQPTFNGILVLDGGCGAPAIEQQAWLLANDLALYSWLTDPSYTRSLFINSGGNGFGEDVSSPSFHFRTFYNNTYTRIDNVESTDLLNPSFVGPSVPTSFVMAGTAFAHSVVFWSYPIPVEPTVLLFDLLKPVDVVLSYTWFEGRLVIGGGITDPYYWNPDPDGQNFLNNLLNWGAGAPAGPSPSLSLSSSGSLTPSSTLSSSLSASSSQTPSSSQSLSNTASTSSSLTPSRTNSVTPTASVSLTPSSSGSISTTLSSSVSLTPSATASTSVSLTSSSSISLSPSSSLSASVSVTPTSSVSLTPSASSSLSSSTSLSVSLSTSSSITPTASLSFSVSAPVSTSSTPSRSRSSAPSRSLSSDPSFTPSESLSSFPSSTSSFIPLPPSNEPNTPTPTPTHTVVFKTPEIVIEGPDGEDITFCPDPKFPYGCDKKCFASPLDCIPKDGGGGDTDIIPVDVVVQTGFTVDVLVLDQTGLSVGEVKVPPGAFPEGTVLTVGSFIGETPEEQDEKKCGGTEAGTKRVSGIFDIKAYEPNGKRAQPKKDIDITMMVQLPPDQSIKPEDLCFAFNQGNEGDEWGCQDSSNFRFKKLKNNTYEITNKFNHFTGFSALLGDPGASGDGCGDSGATYRWLACGFLAGAAVFVFVTCLVYYLHDRGQRRSTLRELNSIAGTFKTSSRDLPVP